MLKQQHTLQQTQKLSPLQIQVARLLELPLIELEEYVRQEMEENPTLEAGDETTQHELIAGDDAGDSHETAEEISLNDYRTEDDIPDYKLQASNQTPVERQPEFAYTGSNTLAEFLEEQLALRELSPDVGTTARYIIGNLDSNGYLSRPLPDLADDIAFATGQDIPTELLEEALSVVQELDPAGVGATDLRECMLLQLERRRANDATNLAYRVIDTEFEAFSKKHYEKIERNLNVTQEELRQALQEILTLTPKPGNAWSDPFAESREQIIPDFLIENIDGELLLSLNNANIPALHVSGHYIDLFEDWNNNRANRTADTRNALQFVKQKIDSARWFIEAIKQRHQTLTRTMQVIIRLQREFFLTGDESKLRPMILKDVAAEAGYDISTISRVSNSKYVQTDFGVYPLKSLFGDAFVTTEEGEEISSREIKKILTECIEQEDKKKPLPDDKLSEMLKERGYLVARRTVAKYREQLGIPVARLRKEI